jgi:hypothetical protein
VRPLITRGFLLVRSELHACFMQSLFDVYLLKDVLLVYVHS